MACAINVTVPCACCKAAKKGSNARSASKRAAKNGRVRRICDGFTRWRAYVFGFATRHEYEAHFVSTAKIKANKGGGGARV